MTMLCVKFYKTKNLAWLLTVIVASVGCNDVHEKSGAVRSSEYRGTHSLEGDHNQVTYRDRLDRTVEFQDVPKRIVSLSPESTELIYAIGAGSKLVGVTDFCDHPPEAGELPKVGLGTAESISREQILSLQPDLVVCRWDTHARLIPTFDRFGIAVIAVGPQTVDQLCEEARNLGKVLGVVDQAQGFAQQYQADFSYLQSQIPTSLNQGTREQSVYYEIWNSPPITAGPSSFIGQLLELAGLKNIFSEVTLPSPQISFESVIERNPAIILIPSDGSGVDRIAEIKQRAGWQSIDAVRNNRIYYISGDLISRCGPRMVEAFQELLGRIYPDTQFERSSPVEPEAGNRE